MAGVLVFAEQRDGIFRNAAFEAVSVGRRLAGELNTELVVAIVGAGVGNVAASLGRYGADRVIVADAPHLARFSSDGYTTAVTNIARSFDPSVLLLSASVTGKALGSAVAARLETGLATD
ncbi:uncharacterized protein METZ01_LOCUS440261, partial [marine metagenome]